MRYNAHINKTYTRKENTEMKKLLAILLVLTAVITCAGLTACNKDENESSAAGSTAGDGSTAPKASPTSKARLMRPALLRLRISKPETLIMSLSTATLQRTSFPPQAVSR